MSDCSTKYLRYFHVYHVYRKTHHHVSNIKALEMKAISYVLLYLPADLKRIQTQIKYEIFTPCHNYSNLKKNNNNFLLAHYQNANLNLHLSKNETAIMKSQIGIF